jgi:L,D-peptidoglycan transpeptidase YkuD (ErfK/YbiS/YcfS/YnhG family)
VKLIVYPDGHAEWNGRRLRCALGRSGIARDKREGDGATPGGIFPFRRALYRADRLARPRTVLDIRAIEADDGWCDDPASPDYNRPVRLPSAARHERLMRQDGLYDLIVVLGHNDDPVVAGRGSAIFLHVAAPGFAPTEGCVALARDDLLFVLADCGRGDGIETVSGLAAPGDDA